MLIVTPQLKIPLGEFQFTSARSSGPGGQNVNKLNTKVVLRWPLLRSASLPAAVRARLIAAHRRRLTSGGELLIASQRFREAGRNKADCLEKLRRMLLQASRPPLPRKPTRPTRTSVRRRRKNKQEHALKKHTRRAPTAEP